VIYGTYRISVLDPLTLLVRIQGWIEPSSGQGSAEVSVDRNPTAGSYLHQGSLMSGKALIFCMYTLHPLTHTAHAIQIVTLRLSFCFYIVRRCSWGMRRKLSTSNKLRFDLNISRPCQSLPFGSLSNDSRPGTTLVKAQHNPIPGNPLLRAANNT
jgi:hypothetical protein